MRAAAITAAFVSLAFTTLAPAQQATCDRVCLTKFIDGYYSALVANNPAGLPQAASARITENAREKKLADTFWPAADKVIWRFDAVNVRRGDTGTQVVIQNVDGSKTMHLLRLKVKGGAITEMEIIKANQGDADRLVGSSRVDLQACKLEYSIVSPK